jgi:hypothetical protein
LRRISAARPRVWQSRGRVTSTMSAGSAVSSTISSILRRRSLEAAGIPQPDTIDGIKQRPMDGVSMAYTWDKANAEMPSRRTTQYFEMLGNRAVYHEGWVAATTPATLPWELSTKPAPDVITGYTAGYRRAARRARLAARPSPIRAN